MAESSGIRRRSGLEEFMLERVEPMEPLIKSFAGARGKGDVFDFRMYLAGIFESEMGAELDVGKQVRFREEH
jgi:hypothetical protein